MSKETELRRYNIRIVRGYEVWEVRNLGTPVYTYPLTMTHNEVEKAEWVRYELEKD